MKRLKAAACAKFDALVTSLASPADTFGQTTSTCAPLCPQARQRAFRSI